MSRIGNKAIALENGVTFERQGDVVTVKGPKGTLTQAIDKGVKTEVKDNAIHFTYENPELNAKQGLARALVHNMVVGVSRDGTKRWLSMVSAIRHKQVETNLF